MGSILCGGEILRHVTKMFCSPNRSAHGPHGRKTVCIRAKINEHGTVLVNSTDPCEKDPDSASFCAEWWSHNTPKKWCPGIRAIPRGSTRNTRGRVKTSHPSEIFWNRGIALQPSITSSWYLYAIDPRILNWHYWFKILFACMQSQDIFVLNAKPSESEQKSDRKIEQREMEGTWLQLLRSCALHLLCHSRSQRCRD